MRIGVRVVSGRELVRDDSDTSFTYIQFSHSASTPSFLRIAQTYIMAQRHSLKQRVLFGVSLMCQDIMGSKTQNSKMSAPMLFSSRSEDVE
jgi:hypothetical protein